MKISRSRIYAWHSWLGLATGLFMILIGFSGAIAVFKHEIDWMVTPALRVAPGGAQASLDRVHVSVQERYPALQVEGLNLQEGPRSAHMVSVRGADGKRLQVLVDPVTAGVRGERAVVGQIWPISNLIRQFHVRLLMGFWGRVFVGAFGVALFLSCLTGLYIYRNWIRSLFRIRSGLGLRMLVSDLHKSVGLFSLLFNLVIAATGAVLGLENLYNKARHDWLGVPREQRPKLEPEVLRDYGDSVVPLPPSALYAAALGIFPEMKPRSIYFPAQPDGSILVTGDPEGVLVSRNTLKVSLDPFRGTVLAARDDRRGGLGSWLYGLVEPLHFGSFGGRVGGWMAPWAGVAEYVVKLIWCFLGMTPGALALSGYWLWASRKRMGRRPSMKAGRKSGGKPGSIPGAADDRKSTLQLHPAATAERDRQTFE